MTEDEIIKTIKENIDKVELKFNSVIIIDFTKKSNEKDTTLYGLYMNHLF